MTEVYALEVQRGRSDDVMALLAGVAIERATFLPALSGLLKADIWVLEAGDSVTTDDLKVAGVNVVEGSAEHVFYGPPAHDWPVSTDMPAFPPPHENTTPGIGDLPPDEFLEVVRPVTVRNIRTDLPLGAPGLSLGPTAALQAFHSDAAFEEIMGLIQARGLEYPGGSIIAIIDSGIDGTRLPEWKKIGGWTDVEGGDPWVDDYGHGTMVALTAAAEEEFAGFRGVDPTALLYSIKLGVTGNGSMPTASILKGMDAALQLAQDTRKRVVLNNSWGLFGCKQLFLPCDILITRVVRALESRSQMITTWAAGNNRHICDQQVTAYCMNTTPWSVTVGAVDSQLAPHFYSSGGGQCYQLQPTVVAPTYGVQPWGSSFTDFGSQGGGTSQATPMVSGALAILDSLFPRRNNLEMRAALRAGASPLNPNRPYVYYDPLTGSGLLQVANSIEEMPQARFHPTVQYERDFPTTIGE